MSTNALVAIKDKDIYTGIYVHWDGYPEALGETLVKHYNSVVKACRLISKGDASTVASTIETCEFYKSKGDSWESVKPHYFTDIEDELKDSAYEYVYVFEPDTMKWDCYDVNEGQWRYVETRLSESHKPNLIDSKRLSDKRIDELLKEHIDEDHDLVDIIYLIRAVEQEHGIEND